MSNGHLFLALELLQSNGCCETSPSSSGVSLSLSFLPFIQHGLNKETSAETPQQTSPNQGKINLGIWDVFGGVGCQGALWELGAKSLELQIRVGRDPMEPGPRKCAAGQPAMGILTGKDTRLKKDTLVQGECYKWIYIAERWKKS